jgi:glutaredoxin
VHFTAKPSKATILFALFCMFASRAPGQPVEAGFTPNLLAGSAVAQAPADSTADVERRKADTAVTSEPVLFAASWCAYCRQARAYLARVGIKYTEIDVDSPTGKAAFAAVGGGGVPLLVANGQQLRGYSELAYDYFFASQK